jgi:hypothetical protein
MNDRNEERREVERLLEMMRLAEPSAALRERAVAAAKEAWDEEPAQAPWWIGFRRLAISAAAAALIVSCSRYFSDLSVAKWQAGRPFAAVVAQNGGGVSDPPYNAFVGHVAAARRTSRPDPVALLESMQELHRMSGLGDTELQ